MNKISEFDQARLGRCCTDNRGFVRVRHYFRCPTPSIFTVNRELISSLTRSHPIPLLGVDPRLDNIVADCPMFVSSLLPPISWHGIDRGGPLRPTSSHYPVTLPGTSISITSFPLLFLSRSLLTCRSACCCRETRYRIPLPTHFP